MAIDPAYYRAWRAAHPEYRKRQTELRADRRLRNGREDRTVEYSRRPSRAIDLSPVPGLHQGHPLFDRARAIVGPRTTSLVTVVDVLYDDLVSEAVVALVEGSDPRHAVRRFGRLERAWGAITAPLIPELIAA